MRKTVWKCTWISNACGTWQRTTIPTQQRNTKKICIIPFDAVNQPNAEITTRKSKNRESETCTEKITEWAIQLCDVRFVLTASELTVSHKQKLFNVEQRVVSFLSRLLKWNWHFSFRWPLLRVCVCVVRVSCERVLSIRSANEKWHRVAATVTAHFISCDWLHFKLQFHVRVVCNWECQQLPTAKTDCIPFLPSVLDAAPKMCWSRMC